METLTDTPTRAQLNKNCTELLVMSKKFKQIPSFLSDPVTVLNQGN